jgi:sugar lactone lactonase YvrE
MSANASTAVPPLAACVLDARAIVGEGPTWSAAEQVLYWVDIHAPSLNRFDPATGRNTAMPMPASIGCFALRRGGGFIVALRTGIWLARPDGSLERKLVEPPYDQSTHRFNDGRCDLDGRFFVGSINERRDRRSAALYRLDGSALTEVAGDVMVSNGLAFSPDGRTLYHSDTPALIVRAWDYDRAQGTLGNGRVFVQFTSETDRPDGAAVDSEGCYWSAFYRGGKVVRFAPDGTRLSEVPVPAMCPTMCAFGGPNLSTLYITTARENREPAELKRLPYSGGIFAIDVGVRGYAEPMYAG